MVNFFLLDGHFVPFVLKIEAVGVAALYAGRFSVGQGTNLEILLKRVLELLGRHIVQRLDDAVVVEDEEVVSRVEQRHEVVEGFLAGDLLASIECSLSAQFAHVVSRSSSVMTISHIQGGNLSKLLNEELGVLDGALPHRVADLILTRHVSVWLRCLNNMSHARLDSLLVVFESEEDRANIGGLDICESCPVGLLLGQRELVALDARSLIVLD